MSAVLKSLMFVLTASLIALNTVFWVIVFIPFILIKLVIPPLRPWSSKALIRCAQAWVEGNSWIVTLTPPIKWDVQGLEGLNSERSYLVVSNHQSWMDIFALQHVLKGQIPFLKFFLKQELIWVPLLGLAWWALDFPFMKRYSREKLEQHPELRGKDIETTRKYCARFRDYPVSVINFLEGSRFTPSKHARQKSPFKHLLRPKAGGVALVLAALGDQLTEVLDVTIDYPYNSTKQLILQLLRGEIKAVTVRIRRLPVPENVAGRDYLSDEAYQRQIQTWVNELWQDKDLLLEALRLDTTQTAPASQVK